MDKLKEAEKKINYLDNIIKINIQMVDEEILP